ncbi:MAG: hypothetical protein ACREL5_08095 [Gemmatimonadales bacterium]
MNASQLFAHPGWVNLLVLVPLVSFAAWRRTGLDIAARVLIAAGLFGIAFGFVEATVVVYLRAALGLIGPVGGPVINPPPLASIPGYLLAAERMRESATIVMLVAVAMLGARRARERWALFLFVFAWWDIYYYLGLRLLTGWPPSPMSTDILFLIPVPWVAEVWYPLLVSGLSVAAVLYVSVMPRHVIESDSR